MKPKTKDSVVLLNETVRKLAHLCPDGPFRRSLAKRWNHFLHRRHPLQTVTRDGEAFLVAIEKKDFYQTWEPETLATFLRQLERGQTVWDIGAYLGLYSILSAKKVGPSGQVHAWEATPESITYCQEAFAANDLAGYCFVHGEAMSDASQSHVNFQIGQSAENRIDPNVQGVNVVSVPTTNLDRCAQTYGAPDLIKMDIEGAESTAFEAGVQLLQGDFGKKPIILLSLHLMFMTDAPSVQRRLTEILSAAGYQVFTIKGKPAGLEEAAEYFLVPQAKVGQFLKKFE